MTADKSMKILLVEDSTFVRIAAKKALHEIGFKNVVEAKDGDHAITILEENSDYSLIISDWVMPNKDGFELLLWVRSNEQCLHIPFIMATSRGEKKQVTKATQSGASGFITKPYSASDFDQVISETFMDPDQESKKDPKPRKKKKTRSGKTQLKVAHIQITDHLGLGVLNHLLAVEQLEPRHFELETICMPSWNPVQKALEKGEVDIAFILAPIAMDLFGFGVPIKLVSLAHKNGSIFVWKKNGDEKSSLQQMFRNKTFYIPHELSVHHMLTHKFLKGIDLEPGFQARGADGNYNVFFEVVPPVKMPEYLAGNPEAVGFSVAEPLGTKAIAGGNAELMFLSGELWENHPCCVVAVRDELIDKHGDSVHEFVDMLVQAGQYIDQRPESAASIAIPFLDPTGSLGLKEAVLKNVLKENLGIKTYDLYPNIEDFERIQRYMVDEMDIGGLIDLDNFIEIQFAEAACKELPVQKSIMRDVSKVAAGITSTKKQETNQKSRLNLEGQYVILNIKDSEFGIDAIDVTEIIEMPPISAVPMSPPHVKGMINYRGTVVPIVDLGEKLGMGSREYDKYTRIIIMEIPIESASTQIGIVADSVHEIIDINASEIEEAPQVVNGISSNYLRGLLKSNGSIKILLNTDQIFSESDKYPIK